jgi:hypothetical protein
LDTAVTREARTLLQTWIDAKFASDCLMGFSRCFHVLFCENIFNGTRSIYFYTWIYTLVSFIFCMHIIFQLVMIKNNVFVPRLHRLETHDYICYMIF